LSALGRGVGVGVLVGGSGVGVGGTGVAVAVGGTGDGVSVGGTGVAVAVGGTGVAVGGTGVLVTWATASGVEVEPHPAVKMPRATRPTARNSLQSGRSASLEQGRIVIIGLLARCTDPFALRELVVPRGLGQTAPALIMANPFSTRMSRV
jgi:hypothetical protein